MLLPHDHQVWKIYRVLVRRGIGAVIKTELAIIAFVDDPVVIGRRQLGNITLVDVDTVQQGVEGGAEVEASPAPVADLIDPEGFFLEMPGVWRLEKAEAFHIP